MEEKTIVCAGCKRVIPDVNAGQVKHVNGKWYCTTGCAKKAVAA